MTDYKALVERLRVIGTGLVGQDQDRIEAANAIEELEARIAEMVKRLRRY